MSSIKPIETEYKGYRFRSRLEARWAVFFDALGIEYQYEPEGFELPSGKRYLPDFKVKCHGVRGDYNSLEPICQECIHHNRQAVTHSTINAWFDEFCEFCDLENDWYNSPNWLKTDRHGDIISCSKRESPWPIDLWIEVKGEMTQQDADKITEFASCGNSILVVGNIPDPDSYSAHPDNLHSYEDMNGIRIYPWNYETIDGDYFAAYPAVDRYGNFYLDGADSNYQTMDLDIIREAFRAARQARFEHSERRQ